MLMGPKVVVMDPNIFDLLEVDTVSHTFKVKMSVSLDWEDDGATEKEMIRKRGLRGISNRNVAVEYYWSGKYRHKPQYDEDPLSTTFNPRVCLVNAIDSQDPKDSFVKVNTLSRRPVVSQSLQFQPECRCNFTLWNYPFDEIDLIMTFSTNHFTSDKVRLVWVSWLTQNLHKNSIRSCPKALENNFIFKQETDEFSIIDIRGETGEIQRENTLPYDGGHFYPIAVLRIRVRRNPYSYLVRVATVMMMLLFLETISFLTDAGDLVNRFSISGTTFLAMVALYYPTVDFLQTVPVVTRVDKWNLFCFALMFASNCENLLAHCLVGAISARALQNFERSCCVLYLTLVIVGFLWFIYPARARYDKDRIYSKDLFDAHTRRKSKTD